jgi:Cys-rich protein (TIGR01571 family)
MNIVDSCIAPCSRGTWVSSWAPPEELRSKFLRHVDYRDYLPPSMQDVVTAYRSHVRESMWTVGLLEMWAPKAKLVKQAVHVPCWDSYRILPCGWRGIFFGRTWPECLWAGWRQMRWARAAYGGALGREYVMPVWNIGSHSYDSDIRALFGLSCALACVFSCGIGQILSLCGNVCINFGAVYTCNSRRKIRQRYNLPPAIPCCPPGLDDWIVHFFCFYCASHQELRELAIRGIDGPGFHVLDVVPGSYMHVDGIDAAIRDRKQIVDKMLDSPPIFFKSHERFDSERMALLAKLDEAFLASAANTIGTIKGAVMMNDVKKNKDNAGFSELGWVCHAPAQQEMQRTNSDVVSNWSNISRAQVLISRECECHDVDLEAEFPHLRERSWSIAY